MSSIHERVAKGDRAAMLESIDRYGALVWSIISRLLSDRGAAAAALEETFLTLWRNAHRFDPGLSSEEVFVAVVARRRALERIAHPRPPRRELDLMANPSISDECCPEAAIAAGILEAMATERRQVLSAAILTGRAPDELAPALSQAPETIRELVTETLGVVREGLLSPTGSLDTGDT